MRTNLSFSPTHVSEMGNLLSWGQEEPDQGGATRKETVQGGVTRRGNIKVISLHYNMQQLGAVCSCIHSNLERSGCVITVYVTVDSRASSVFFVAETLTEISLYPLLYDFRERCEN